MPIDFIKRAREVMEIEIEAIRQTQARLDGAFDQAIQLLIETLQARRKIITIGVGKSGLIGQKIAATLSSTGAPSVVLDAVNATHGDLGIVAEKDLALALSYSGETEELVRILPVLRRLQVRTIAFTGNPHSTLAKQATVHLNVHVNKEACPLNLAPTSSTTAMLALGDALAMVLLEAQGFREEDFARFHPSGMLGRRLLLRIHDIMRPLEELVVLPSSSTVGEALSQWSSKRVGSAIVVHEDQTLAGIYTHSDFVRGFHQDPQIGRYLLKEVMTPDPIRVQVDKLAVEVLNLIEKYRIDDLIVVDSQSHPVGLVDSQDLARQKLI